MRVSRKGLFLLLTLLVLSPGLRGQQIVCYFGDSITEGWIEGERRPQDAFPLMTDSLIADIYKPVRILVQGKGGTTTDNALEDIDGILMRGTFAIVIEFGANDMYIWGRDPAPRVPLERFRTNLRLLTEKIQGIGMFPVLLGMPPIIESRFYASGADSTLYAPYGGAAAMNARYNQAIADVAQDMQCPFVSVEEAFAGDSTLLGFDGVHPLPAGHRRIAESLAPVVADLLTGRRTSPPLTDIAVWPNPWSPGRVPYCTIGFSAQFSRGFHLVICDISGRVVWQKDYWSPSTGRYFVPWDGRDRQGTRVAPGAYMLYIQAYRFTAHYSILVW